MTDQEKLSFIDNIAKYVKMYAPIYGICVYSPIIAQACLESAYGTSNKAKYHNYFGLKYREGRLDCHNGYFTDTSSEQNADGTYTEISTDWFSFSDMEHGVEGYFQFINISNYNNLKGVTDPRTYLEYIKSDGYATSIDYVDNLMDVIETWDLTQYDDPIVSRGINIAVDSGHGSETAGKRHPDGYREHWSDTYMAFYLYQILVKNGFSVLKTSWDDDNPTDDEDVALSTRQSQIKAFNAKVSVSIHANASGDGSSYNDASGVSTHYHNDSSKVGDSVALATAIQNQMILNTEQNNRGIVAQELAMCNCTAMGTEASVLVETAFMTNSRESELLRTDEFCIECAREIAQGLFNYLEITDADSNVSVTLADRSYTDSTTMDLSDASITLDNPTVVYHGGENCPAPTVIYNGITLVYNTHYSIEYSNNINAGIGITKVIGIGSYTGSQEVTFTIEPRTLKETGIVDVGEEDADGCVDLSNMKVYCIGKLLVQDVDYTLTIDYSDLNGYKFAACYIDGINNYKDQLVGGYYIEKYPEEEEPVIPEEPDPIDINTIQFIVSTHIYDGTEFKPTITCSGLVENTDYTVSYEGDFVNVGTPVIIITGINNYTNTKSITTNIYPKDISEMDISLAFESCIYDGNEVIPSIIAEELTINIDYSVVYEGDFINAGDNIVEITGINNYTGSKYLLFTINPCKIIDVGFYLDCRESDYTGALQYPSVINDRGLRENYDYKVIYNTDFINAGNHTLRIEALNGNLNYTGYEDFIFTINPADINNVEYDISYNTDTNIADIDTLILKYNHSIFLEENVDYTKTVKINNNEDTGYSEATITINGINNFENSMVLVFNVDKLYKQISDYELTILDNYFEFTGLPIEVELTVKNSEEILEEGIDYVVSYFDYINAGTATVVVTGIGDYIGELKQTYVINPLSLTNDYISVSIEAEGNIVDINSLEVRNIISDKLLVENTDYKKTITYSENIEDLVKLAYITLTGISNYTDTRELEYIVEILPEPEPELIDINTCKIIIEENNIYNHGIPLTPDVEIYDTENNKLVLRTDYNISYSNNVNAGAGSISINGNGKYTGTIHKNFNIDKFSITEGAYIDILLIKDDIYDIESLKVIIKDNNHILVEGKDYNKNIKLIEDIENKIIISDINITGINNYTGNLNRSVQTGIIEEPEDIDPEIPEDPESLYIGKPVELLEAKLYTRYCSKKHCSNKTGIYYIWSDKIVNDRIRVTTSKEFAGKPGLVSGWISLKELFNNQDELKIGDIVTVTGNLNKYADGSGNTINKNNEIMYIADIINDTKTYPYNYALSSGPNRARQGWAKQDMLKKYVE